MPLIEEKALLLEAQRKKQAIPAFNVENMEFVQGVISAAEKTGYPVILQTTPSTAAYASLHYMAGMVLRAAQKSPARIALHLDHGDSIELAEQAMKEGYNSVMIDGSGLPFEDNVRMASEVTKKAAFYRVSVEAELGTVGGKEDSAVSTGIQYTKVAEAVEFVERTGVDSLAVAIGTAHGFYKGEPQLNFDRLREIREKVQIPLVLHGTSGVPYETVQSCISLGICKVNYATDLRIAFTDAVLQTINRDSVDPKKYLKTGRAAVEAAAIERIGICRCG